MLEVWLKAKNELRLILELMLGSRDYDIELGSYDYDTKLGSRICDIELGSPDYHMTIALQ